MEPEKLENSIYKAIFNRDVKEIKELKDFYKSTNGTDISTLKIKFVDEQIEVFKWILEHPDYNFDSLFNGYFAQFYTNKELLNYFTVYYEYLQFSLKRYNEKKFIINYSDFK